MVKLISGGSASIRPARWAAALGLALVAVACGGGTATPATTTSAAPVDVTIGVSQVNLSNTGMYVAIEKGYFRDAGVNVNLTQLSSGATASQAMASRSVDLVASGALDVGAATAQGIPFQAIAVLSGVTLELCTSKKLAAAHNITSTSSVNEVMSSFKGATFGITGANSAPDSALRYLLVKYGNLKPDVDVKIVSLGSLAAVLTAFGRAQIDGFIQSPPSCLQTIGAGTGVRALLVSQVPALLGTPQTVIYSRRDWIDSNKSTATKVASATAKGDLFARDHTDETVAVLLKYFSGQDPVQLKQIFTEVVQPVIPKDAKASATGWSRLSDELLSAGMITKPLNTKEGTIWTNAYIH